MESRAASYAQVIANFMTAMRQRCSEPDAQQAVLERLYGLTRIDEAQYRHVRMLGGSRLDQCLTLQMPVGIAWVIRAFPHAVAYGFVGTAFQEFVGGDSGLGSVLIYGLNELSSAVVMATVVILSLLGWLLFWLGSHVGQASAPWRRELGI